MTLWYFFATHRHEILAAIEQHLVLVVISMAIAIGISVPLGMVIVSRPHLRALAMALANIFQTIPSLALFGFLIPLPFIGGIGARTAIVALVLYALLPILRNTYVDKTTTVTVQNVDPDVGKLQLANMLARKEPGPGYVHLPCGVNGEDAGGWDIEAVAELTAEYRREQHVRGYTVTRWYKRMG